MDKRFKQQLTHKKNGLEILKNLPIVEGYYEGLFFATVVSKGLGSGEIRVHRRGINPRGAGYKDRIVRVSSDYVAGTGVWESTGNFTNLRPTKELSLSLARLGVDLWDDISIKEVIEFHEARNKARLEKLDNYETNWSLKEVKDVYKTNVLFRYLSQKERINIDLAFSRKDRKFFRVLSPFPRKDNSLKFRGGKYLIGFIYGYPRNWKALARKFSDVPMYSLNTLQLGESPVQVLDQTFKSQKEAAIMLKIFAKFNPHEIVDRTYF